MAGNQVPSKVLSRMGEGVKIWVNKTADIWNVNEFTSQGRVYFLFFIFLVVFVFCF